MVGNVNGRLALLVGFNAGFCFGVSVCLAESDLTGAILFFVGGVLMWCWGVFRVPRERS
jgi:hypothetical protein